jgi:DNA-binding TFAR19-related protein (PDSD5 family)
MRKRELLGKLATILTPEDLSRLENIASLQPDKFKFMMPALEQLYCFYRRGGPPTNDQGKIDSRWFKNFLKELHEEYKRSRPWYFDYL